MVDHRVLVVVVQFVPDRIRGDLFVAQDILDPVEGAAVGHEGTGHGAAPAGGHVGAGPVGQQAMDVSGYLRAWALRGTRPPDRSAETRPDKGP